tara:strand:- start:8040 stop:8252 length:213 start_codon:yes stop_codon:yes gene_type:complete
MQMVKKKTIYHQDILRISHIVGIVLNQLRRRFTITINTNCDICGGSLLHPEEIKEGIHEVCFKEWKKQNY